MRKPPEMLVMLAPAALVTAVVITFGFAAGGDSDGGKAVRRSSTPTVSAEPTTTSPTPQGLDIPSGKLLGPKVTLRPKPRPKFKIYDPFSFTIASFNVLGHSHTVPGGNKRGYAGSRTRTGWALSALSGHGVDIVGLQEFQAPQHDSFMARAGGAWDVYPGTGAGHLTVENSIAWREDIFEEVEAHTITIPYFGGQPRQMPYVLLRHLGTGQRLWVANFHNPASGSRLGNNAGWRNQATGRQIALANRLDDEGYPVFFTGDMNERMEYCAPFTSSTTLKSAHGEGSGSPCGSTRGMQVDWIFGSDQVTFSGYQVDDSRFIDRTTDHPLVVSNVTVPEYKERIVYKKRAAGG